MSSSQTIIVNCTGCGRDVKVSEKVYRETPLRQHLCIRCGGRRSQIDDRSERAVVNLADATNEDDYGEDSYP